MTVNIIFLSVTIDSIRFRIKKMTHSIPNALKQILRVYFRHIKIIIVSLYKNRSAQEKNIEL